MRRLLVVLALLIASPAGTAEAWYLHKDEAKRAAARWLNDPNVKGWTCTREGPHRVHCNAVQRNVKFAGDSDWELHWWITVITRPNHKPLAFVWGIDEPPGQLYP